MIWQEFAIDELKKHLSRQMARLNLEDRISELNSQAVSLGGNSNSIPTQGDHAKIEDKWLNIVVQRDKLAENLKAVEQALIRVDRGLKTLDEREWKILNEFYVHRTSGYIDRLCDELHVEKSTLYRIKDGALYKFTIAMYGVAD